jgi:hypothetical protein
MLQSSGVKQPHDPGDWASYLLARRRCTSPAPPREPDRAGGTLRPPHIERRAASRALRPRRLALRTRGDRAREPGGGKISASRPGAAIERSRPRSIFFAPPNISSRRRPAHTHSVRQLSCAVPPSENWNGRRSILLRPRRGRCRALGPGVVFVSWLLGLERLPWHSRRSALATFLGGQELPVSANQSQTSSAHWHIEALTLEFGRNPLEQLTAIGNSRKNAAAI